MPSGGVTPVSSGPAHVAPGTIIQTGSGTPLNSVTPTAEGALYQDLTNGGLWVAAAGSTSADWHPIGGAMPNQFNNGSGAYLDVAANGAYVVGRPSALMTDSAAMLTNGTENGWYWNSSGGADGAQTAGLQVGVAGAFFHQWTADGVYQLAAAGVDGDDAVQLGQISPLGTITSGALPTLTITSGTGRQISTTRDAETVTPFSGDGTNSAATCAIALSSDNVTYSTMATVSIAAALNLTGVLTDNVSVRVPAGWYLKLTATHGTLGTTTYY